MHPTNSPTPKLGDLIELTIDSLSYHGGRGVGRVEGLVVFVPDSAPGDRLRVRLTEQKPRFFVGEIDQIISPSSLRRVAPCPVFQSCGGCVWQHVTYDGQKAEKEKILRSSLKSLDREGLIQWRPFVGAPSEFHYRNRIQLQIQNGKVGFFARKSRDLVPIEECLIAEPALNRALSSLRRHDNSRVELAVLADGSVVEREPEFTQVNSAQNKNLRAAVVAAIMTKPSWILDLYCGAGNLTIPLAKQFPDAQIIGVEMNAAAIERAKIQFKEFKNVEWHAVDVARFLKSFRPKGDVGVIVLDPPRVGASKDVIEALTIKSASQIVYVSCNPMTFARDAERILKIRKSWKMTVEGFDMFPQTEHVELVASLCAAT